MQCGIFSPYKMELKLMTKVMFTLMRFHFASFSMTLKNASIDLRPHYRFHTVSMKTLCLHFHLDPLFTLLRAFSHWCDFAENVQRLSVDRRPKRGFKRKQTGVDRDSLKINLADDSSGFLDLFFLFLFYLKICNVYDELVTQFYVVQKSRIIPNNEHIRRLPRSLPILLLRLNFTQSYKLLLIFKGASN